MIKEAMNFIIENFKPIHLAENDYWVNERYRKVRQDVCKPVDLSSLDGIVDFINSKSYHIADKLFLHIDSYSKVILAGELNQDSTRNIYAVSECLHSKHCHDIYHDLEKFIITLKSNFVQCETIEKLLQISSSIDLTDTASLKDDGISQEASVKSGVHLIGKEKLPSLVSLRPYSTFTEIEQPKCEFVFRVKKGSECQPKLGLFECLNANWQLKAVSDIYEYLKTKVEIPIIR